MRKTFFPDPRDLHPDEHGLVALGGRLSVPILIEAYSKGLFPWTGRHPIPWYSPDPRLILDPKALRVSRSLRKRIRRGDYTCRMDTAFRDVMRACATVPRPDQDGTWITPNMVRAYGELHDRHIAHSVEIYVDDQLVGGLYGIALGRAFFGESMFHRARDVSKLAFYHLCERLAAHDYHLVDCQQETAHLASLGAFAVPRGEYLDRLDRAMLDATDACRWQGPATG